MNSILSFLIKVKWGPIVALGFQILQAIRDAIQQGKTDKLSDLVYDEVVEEKYKAENGGPCTKREFQTVVDLGEDIVRIGLKFKIALLACFAPSK